MANLNSIAELVWRQLFPDPTVQTKTKKEEVQASAKTEYAYQLWLKLMADKREDGYIEAPSYLLSEVELDVEDNEIDISDLKIMRGLPWEIWLQNLGGINCDCRYVKSTVNLAQVLCDDDSLGDSDKTFYVVGKMIKLPKGAHKDKLPLIYANSGESVDGKIEVDDTIGGIVRRSLFELYGGRIGNADKTNNDNPEN